MVVYWDTDEAQQRSSTYSKCRMSERDSLSPHIHLSGPTSFQERKDEMGEELGRPVSLGEVFVKTHTKPDGTFVDRKAEKIAQTYEKNLEDKLAEIQAEPSCVSDGTSRPRELTTDDYTTIFLQSTEKDSRGIPYGVGSINLDNVEASNQPGDSSAFMALEEKLKAAQPKFDEQARREAEHSLIVAEHKDKLEHFSLVEEYLRQSDPVFLDFLATRSTTTPSSTPPAS